MTVVQIALITTLLVVLVIASICYGVYTYIFVRIRHTINRMYALQEQYKELAAVSFAAATRPLELLMKDRPRYNYVVSYMKWFARRYQSQLDLAGDVVNKLRDLKRHFALKQTTKTLDELQARLALLKSWVDEFGSLIADAFTYQNATASMLVAYRQLANNIEAFIRTHLIPKFDSPVFKTSLTQIMHNFQHADQAASRFENDLLVRCLQHLRNALHTLLGYATRLYIGDKRLDYLAFLASQSANLHGAHDQPVVNGQSANANMTYRALTEVNDNIAKARRLLHLFQFRDAIAIADDVARTLEPLTQGLAREAKARDIVKTASPLLTKWGEIFDHKQAELEAMIARMDHAFGAAPKVAEAAANVRTDLNTLKAALGQLQNAQNDNDRSYDRILRLMMGIVDATDKLKTTLRVLLDNVHSRLTEYRAMVFKANDLKLKFAQLRAFVHEHTLHLGHPNDELMNEWVCAVSDREAGLREDYAGSQATFNQFAAAADDALIGLLASVVEAAQLRALAEVTLMYLNKFRNESTSIERAASQIEDLIDDGANEAALRAAIRVLKQINASAREFGIQI